jgi:hypothetical protein
MSDHTPGPWGIVWQADVERIRLNGSTVYQVSDVTDPEFPSGTPRYHLADLTLMAAAPELLAALKELVDYDAGSCEEGDYGYDVLLRCKAAINKAEGRINV